MSVETHPSETADHGTEAVLSQSGAFLLGRLAEALVPEVLFSRDDLALAPPYQENRDFRVGVYLYDIQDFSAVTGPGPERLSASERRLPPKPVELHYLVFANQSIPFGRMRGEEEQLLLEAAVRAFHDGGRLSLPGNPVGLQFSFLALSEKIALWQSFGKPLQPAVYITLSPVLVPSGRILVTPEVREISYRYRTLEQREDRR